MAPVADGAASGAQQGLPTEWRRALVDLQLMLACDSERRKNLRVLLLPLIFGEGERATRVTVDQQPSQDWGFRRKVLWGS